MFKIDPNRDIWSKDLPSWERGQMGGRTRPIDKDILMANLIEVTDCLTKHGIKWWISHGTMLGFYRDGDFITWDDDADISADMKDRSKIQAVIDELKDKGYHIPPLGDPYKPITNDNPPYYDTNFIKNGEKVELWWFQRHSIKENEKERHVYIYDPDREALTHDAKYYDGNLGSMVIKGHHFKVPNNLCDWIVMMYSEDWNQPQPNRKYNQTK